MKTKAMRLYGKSDLRVEEFELPEPKEDEILAHVISDSICMSSYKAAIAGTEHKRIPPDIAEHPVIIGHEFCGVIERPGAKWAGRFRPGDKFVMQTALNLPGDPYAAPGYSFRYVGGSATHIVIPNCVMERDCLLGYSGDAFFFGSLAEPVSCVIGGYHCCYHTRGGSYEHLMGTVKGGKLALLASAGPMGLAAIDYALHCDRRPSLLTVTDIDDKRLSRAEQLYPPEEAEKLGVKLVYLNTSLFEDPVRELLAVSGGTGFDDVFVFAPVPAVIEQADGILGRDGCLNFFAGPTRRDLCARFNFYNVHYMSTHVCGNSGGNTDDMREALGMMSRGELNPSAMITHFCGLDRAPEVTLNLPKIPGGKKLVYTNISYPLTAIADLPELGKTDPLAAKLAEAVEANNGLWSSKAEKILLENAPSI